MPKVARISLILLMITGFDSAFSQCPQSTVISVTRERACIKTARCECGSIRYACPTDYYDRVIRTEETADLGPVATENGYQVRYHPYGRTITEIRNTNGALRRVESVVEGPVFRYPCDIANTQTGTAALDIGYQLKIYSSPLGILPEPPYLLPILIPQGFDPQYGTSRQFNFRRFERQLDLALGNDATGAAITDPAMLGTLRSLYDDSYDVALMLFKNPNIAIETNARVFARAWQFFQSQSRNLYTKEPVIIGPSLGGIVARYALQRQGRDYGESYLNPNVPDCRLLVLLDSPNRGADIPMSLQAMVKYLHTKNDIARALFRVLESPAPAQLLMKTSLARNDETADHTIADYEAETTPHGRFMRDLNNPGFIAQAKKISSNGLGENCPGLSGCPKEPVHLAGISGGSYQGQPYTEGLLYASLSSIPLDLRLYMSQTTAISRVFYGDYWNLNPWTYNLQEPVFLEGVPGGLRSSYGDIRDAVYWDIFQPGVTNHPFIPTISSMGMVYNTDINASESYFMSEAPNPRNPSNDPYTLANSLFDEIYVPRHNQDHPYLTIDPADTTDIALGSRPYLQSSLLGHYLVSETP